MIGQTIAHYKILDKLGQGGMGEVYLADDTKLGRKVALKVLPAEMAGSHERLERFDREARALAALDHPNIVTIHSVEEADGVHFLTMQLVEGSTLDRLIPPGGMPLDRLLESAVALTEAVAAAHSRGIAHRDLKPANVMVTDGGQVKVLDFGLAKSRGALEVGSSALETLEMTREGRVLGTLPYMSPEQALGRPIDQRTDIFSLGSLLYEMTTGRRPFDEDGPGALTAAILTKTPAPISTCRSDAPPRLGQIIQRCLEKDPARRYQDAGELAGKLTALREAVAHHPRISTGLGHLSALLPRTRSVRIGLAGVVVALVAALSLTIWPLRKGTSVPGDGPRISSLAVLPLKNLSGEPEQEYFVDGMTEALITDLSKIGALKVISRSSSIRYKDTQKPLPEIAEELGVEALIEGSVVREGDQVRVTARLIEAGTEANLWADRYDREISSILVLQSEVAQAIVREIRVTLTPEEETLLARARPVNPEAHDAVLKGSYHWKKLTPEALDTALRYFELALEKDPSYAPAYSGICLVWMARATATAAAALPHEAAPRAKEAATRSLELDSELAEPHFALAGIAAWYDWDWETAEREFRLGLGLNPNYADAHVFYGLFLTAMGRLSEATAQIERGLELDPHNFMYRTYLGVALYRSRRFDEAIAECRKGLALEPRFRDALGILRNAYQQKGMYKEALDAERALLAARGDHDLLRALERGSVQGGYAEAMRQEAEALAARSNPAYALRIAARFAFVGANDRALEWLETAYDERLQNMIYLSVSPHWDPLRDDPQFKDLLRRMEFPA